MTKMANCKEFPRNINSSTLPIKRPGFAGDWRANVEVVLFDFFVLSLQLAMVIATVAYFCGSLEKPILYYGPNGPNSGKSVFAESSGKEHVTMVSNHSHSLFSNPKDFLNYIKKVEQAENAKDCWLSLTKAGRALPNCPLTNRVQTALLIGDSNSVRSCWDLLNHTEFMESNAPISELCLQ